MAHSLGSTGLQDQAEHSPNCPLCIAGYNPPDPICELERIHLASIPPHCCLYWELRSRSGEPTMIQKKVQFTFCQTRVAQVVL